MSQKVKRRVNRSKRAKMNTQGFKVHKGFYLHIGKATEGGWSRSGKPAVRTELVDLVRDFFNTDPCIRKIEKHIKGLSITHRKTGGLAGTWDYEEKIVRIFDDGITPIDYFKYTLIHEIIGHAFWDISRKWRRMELVAFNELANKTASVNDYCKKNEAKWKKWDDESDDEDAFKKSISHIPDYDASEELCNEYETKVKAFLDARKTNGHDSMKRYPNEQHSAITELIYGSDHKECLLSDEDLHKLTEAWERLHY